MIQCSWVVHCGIKDGFVDLVVYHLLHITSKSGLAGFSRAYADVRKRNWRNRLRPVRRKHCGLSAYLGGLVALYQALYRLLKACN